jgi:transcriptional regulator with XRE-family HTH domain
MEQDQIALPPPTRARQMKDAGKSAAAIASDFGVSKSTVHRWLRDNPGNAPVIATRARLSSDFPNVLRAGVFTQSARRADAANDIALMNRAGLAFEGLNGQDFIRIALRVSPEISRAVWDFQRMLNPGHEYDVFRPGTETEYPEAKAALDDFIETLDNRYGTIKVLFGKIFLNAITRGAFFSELVLDDAGFVPLDLAIPDPEIVEFKRREDPDLGDVWEIGQRINGEWVSLDRPTIRYIALDAEATSPYGKSMLYPAIFPAMFLVGLMYDLRRVVAQQGYNRGDVEINLDVMNATYPEDDTAQFDERVADTIDDVKSILARLQPDDWFVHTSGLTVNHTDGAIDTSSLGGASTLIDAIERMLVRALKTMPLIMGISDGVSEANANRQWEVFARTIKELQQYAENLLEYDFTLALNVQGFDADVKFRFAELRYAEEMRDAQVLTIKLANAETMERLGFVDHDAASEYAVGHPAAGEKAPPPTMPQTSPQTPEEVEAAKETNPEPGQNRALPGVREAFKPSGAGSPLPPVPEEDDIDIDAGTIRRAAGAWNSALPEYREMLRAEAENDSDGNEDDTED